MFSLFRRWQCSWARLQLYPFFCSVDSLLTSTRCPNTYSGYHIYPTSGMKKPYSTFLFNVMCNQHHATALNPFLNGTKTVALTLCVNKTEMCANVLKVIHIYELIIY